MFALKDRLIFLAFAVVLLALDCSCSPTSSSATVNLVPRSEWGAARPKVPAARLKKIPTGIVVIHHSHSRSCTTKEDCIPLVRAFQRYHMNNNGWDDIGYNFVVGEDANVYVGRGWDKVGAHAPLVNSRSVGICVIGNFTDHVPQDAALRTLKDLITLGVEANHITSDYKLVGHRQVRDTDCPGDAFYEELKTWPHYVSSINRK